MQEEVDKIKIMFTTKKSINKPQESGRVESFIDKDTFIKGDITCNGVLRIDGKWEGGEIKATEVIVGETGYLQGNVEAKSVIIGGKVEGNVTASEKIELHAKSILVGNIRTAHLSILEGAVFEGSCMMLNHQTKPSIELTTATLTQEENE
jgi:cytoskeletal protein CcmA (bactofilin family)